MALDARPPERVEDLRPGRVVEVAGRLVGEEQGRAGHEGACDRHPLLLAGRQLVRLVVLLAGEVDQGDDVADPLDELAATRVVPGDRERQRDVLPDVEERDQVERLEDEAGPIAAQLRGGVVGQLADRFALERDRACGGPIEATEELEEGALAGPRRAHEGDELALGDGQGDAAQRVDGRRPEAIPLGEVARLEDRRDCEHRGQCSRATGRRIVLRVRPVPLFVPASSTLHAGRLFARVCSYLAKRTSGER